MCNLYSSTTAQQAMRQLFDVTQPNDRLGNAEPRTAIWPKYEAPVVRLNAEGQRELVNMRWGFLTPKTSSKTGKPLKPEAWNNARDDKVNSPLWREAFRSRRCLVPATAFREALGRSPAEDWWFGVIQDGRPVPFAFAGLWRDGQPGVGGEESGWLTHTMMTTTANDLVRPIHPTRMPVILDERDYQTWLDGTTDQAKALLKPFPVERMTVIAHGVGMTSQPGHSA